MQGHQFSGATQMLPLGASAEQSAAALASMIRALQGELPKSGHHALKLTRETFAWKEYRVATKNWLCALANSLKQYLPPDWTLAKCRPGNLLAPHSTTGDRVAYLKEEIPPDLKFVGERFFVIDHKSGMRFPDFYLNEDHFRLVFSADEGTEA